MRDIVPPLPTPALLGNWQLELAPLFSPCGFCVYFQGKFCSLWILSQFLPVQTHRKGIRRWLTRENSIVIAEIKTTFIVLTSAVGQLL
jgi:hypothetical protein